MDTVEEPILKTPEDFAKKQEQELEWIHEFEKDDKWKPLGDVNGVKTFDPIKAPAAGVALRSTYTYDSSDNITVEELVNLLTSETERYETDMTELQVVQRISDNERIQVTRWTVGWPASPRELPAYVFVRTEGNKTYIFFTPVGVPDVPVAKGHVRGWCKAITVIEKVEGTQNINIMRINWIDPKGWLPTSIVNSKKTDDANRLLNARKAILSKRK